MPFNYYSLSFQAPGLIHKGFYAGQILKFLIGDSTQEYSSSKARLINEKYKILSQIQANYTYFSDIGIFSINFIGDKNHSKESIDKLIEGLNGLSKVTDEEIEKAKRKYKFEMLNFFENTQQRVEYLAKAYIMTGNITDSKQVIHAIDNVSYDDFREFIQKTLSSSLSLLCIGENLSSISSREQLILKLKP